MPIIEIFRAGKRLDANGVPTDITAGQLQQTADSYNPAYHEAPLVIGHPKADHPAWGWVKALSLDGEVLKAEVDNCDPQFTEMVKQGKFKKVSAAFYAPDSPNNPTPGVLSLRHVGFLGAMPPAVKGLAQVAFSDNETGVLEFADWNTASLFARLREWMVAKFGLEDADRALPHFEVDWLKEDAIRQQLEQRADAAELAAAFNEHSDNSDTSPVEPEDVTPNLPTGEPEMTLDDINALKDENARLKAEKAELEKQAQVAAIAAVQAENAEFAEGLVNAGKLAPAVKAGVLAVLNNLAVMQAGLEPEFAEGETALSQLKTALAASPKIIEFAETATKDNAPADGQDNSLAYAEGTDPASIEADQKIWAYAKANNVDYNTAFAALYQ